MPKPQGVVLVLWDDYAMEQADTENPDCAFENIRFKVDVANAFYVNYGIERTHITHWAAINYPDDPNGTRLT